MFPGVFFDFFCRKNIQHVLIWSSLFLLPVCFGLNPQGPFGFDVVGPLVGLTEKSSVSRLRGTVDLLIKRLPASSVTLFLH